MKNKIILGAKSGKVRNVIFDDCDLSKTTADLRAKLDLVSGSMVLTLEIALNDKFEIEFKEE